LIELAMTLQILIYLYIVAIRIKALAKTDEQDYKAVLYFTN
jgi:hypothetical protein